MCPSRIGVRTGYLRRVVAVAMLGFVMACAAQAEQAPPSLPQYAELDAHLERYRELARVGRLPQLPDPSGAIRPGDRYAGVAALHRWLVAFGDLPERTEPPAGEIYGGPLADGIRSFQNRHGLEPDGVIGAATWKALSTPLSWRVRQIELTRERLRGLPDFHGDRVVIVYIPMFRLWAWDSLAPAQKPALGMRVIVGRARRTPTPAITKVMDSVIFRPYWNIPTSILRGEILPAVAREPGFLAREEMEIVQGPGDAALPVETTAWSLGLLEQGTLRLRQRPGPRNALGLIKFVFPNEESVYLHDTPGKLLFRQPRRDLSHGCVRVEDAVGLATWVLRDQKEWTRDAIVAAIADPRNVSRVVRVKEPVQVVLFYGTAAVMPDDGTLHFAEDIYGYDRQGAETTVQQPPRRP